MFCVSVHHRWMMDADAALAWSKNIRQLKFNAMAVYKPCGHAGPDVSTGGVCMNYREKAWKEGGKKGGRNRNLIYQLS